MCFRGEDDDDDERPDFHSRQNDEGCEGYEWNRFMIMGIVAALCIVISFTFICCYVYFRQGSNRMRHADRRSRRGLGISRARRFSWRGADHDYFLTPAREGLCRAAVDALPVFVYKPESYKDGLSCAVCLCEFEENEKARLLPKCNHSFHVDCIDMWFCSHPTCPVCRASVETPSDESFIVSSHSQHNNECLNHNQNEIDDENCNMEVEVEMGIRVHIAIDIPVREC